MSICSRPDLAYSVGRLCRAVKSPTARDLVQLKRVLRFLSGSVDVGLTFPPPGGDLSVVGFCDAAWADAENSRSTLGCVFTLGNTAVDWRSYVDSSVSLSSAEAEYKSLSYAGLCACWFRKFLADMSLPVETIVVFCDNKGALCLLRDESKPNLARHIETRIHHVRDLMMRENHLMSVCPWI